MSYNTLPTFEGTRIGMRRLVTLGNAGVMLRGVTDTAALLVSTGWDQSLINGLLGVGATDQQLTDLLNGATDVQTILTQAKATQSASNSAVAPQPQNAQSPQGSTVLYSATWVPGIGNLTVSDTNAISQLTALLPQRGLSVLSSKVAGGTLLSYGIQVTIRDSAGHALLSDVTNICNSLMQQIVGSNLTSGFTTLVGLPGQTVASGSPSGTPDLMTWFTTNWQWVALGVGVIVIGLPLVQTSLRGRQ